MLARAAGAYTPVPGGVGPLTIAMLMSNTVELAEKHLRAETPADAAQRRHRTRGQRLNRTLGQRRRIAERDISMLRVGLTGGLASGKTFVGKNWRISAAM